MLFNSTTFTACKLLSSTTAGVTEELFPNDPKMMKFAETVQDIDNWFDVFNSSREWHHHKPLKAAFEGKIHC